MSPLLIIGLPLLAALGLAAVPAERRSVFRWTTILATLGSATAVFVFQSFNGGLVTDPAAAYIAFDDQLTVRMPGGIAKIYFHLGVDGMGGDGADGQPRGLCRRVRCGRNQVARKEFAILLLMTGGILGAFGAGYFPDVLFARAGTGTHLHHDRRLGPRRGSRLRRTNHPYLGLGSLIALAGVILLYLSHGTSDLKEILNPAPRSMPAASHSSLRC